MVPQHWSGSWTIPMVFHKDPISKEKQAEINLCQLLAWQGQ